MLHIIYELNGDIQSVEKDMSFPDAEEWLKSIGATYWEIGLL